MLTNKIIFIKCSRLIVPSTVPVTVPTVPPIHVFPRRGPPSPPSRRWEWALNTYQFHRFSATAVQAGIQGPSNITVTGTNGAFARLPTT